MHALESMNKLPSKQIIQKLIPIILEKSNSDEKFNKLLEAYNKLREEHIVVLRRVCEDFYIQFKYPFFVFIGRRY